MFSTDVYNTFRPSDEALSEREKFQVQAYRSLFSLGAAFVLLYAPFYYAANPEAWDPFWLRLIIASVGSGAVAASYLFERIRRHVAAWGLGVSFLVIGWGLLLLAFNGFRGDYKVGLSLLHAVFTVFAGLGARSIRPVFWFTWGSLMGTAGVVVAGDGSLIEEGVLLSSMAGLSIVVGIAVQRMIIIRDELEERESRLRGLANSVPGIVFQFYARPNGSRGHYFVSEHAEEVLGISSEPTDFLQRVNGCIPSPHRDRVRQSVEGAVERCRTWRVEFPFETPSGDRLWLLGTAAPEVRDDEMIFNGFLLDITGQKRAEHALRQAKEEAEEASRVKTAMLANMSHEVRTPLTSIIGFAEILKDNLDGDLKGFAEQTYESSQRLLETLESVLQLSKLEAGVATLSREEVTLQSVLQQTLALFASQADEKSITLQTTWLDEPVVGLWNADAVRRIGRNLLENALKFTPEGGRVEIRVDRDDRYAFLEVEDTGIGIGDEQIPDIFRAFRQESEGIRREYEGSGLGLSIVDHLVQELNGRVEVATEKGEGTCFTVQLPLRPDDAGSGASETASTAEWE